MGDHWPLWIVGAVVALSVLVLGASLLLRFRRDINVAYTRLERGGSTTVETECGPIESATLGEGQPALVIHGIVGGFDQGLVIADGHLPEGYRSVAPSRFGYLGSPLPEDATVAQQADAFACLLDTLNIDRAAVLGTSAGATSAIQFALRHPDRCSCLVLISPNAPGEVAVAPPPKPVASMMYRSDFAFWLATTYFRSGMSSMMGVPKGFEMTEAFDADVDDVIRTVLPVRPRADGALFDLFTSNPAINEFPLEDLTVPVLIVSAIDDPLALYENSKAMSERIPGAKLVTVPDGGHMMLGHNEFVREAIAAFLEEAVADE
ncbi:alpha/beta fold hydrolase [Candidatus Bipolaricaulota bacterium]